MVDINKIKPLKWIDLSDSIMVASSPFGGMYSIEKHRSNKSCMANFRNDKYENYDDVAIAKREIFDHHVTKVVSLFL